MTCLEATLATPESVSPPAEPAPASPPPPKIDPMAPLMLKYAHFIISCLYSWTANSELDKGIESNGMLLQDFGRKIGKKGINCFSIDF